MRRKFDHLRENLAEFAKQRDYSLLVVGCTTEELAYVAKFLQGLDEALPADFVLVLSSAFHGTVAYVDDLVAGLQTQLAACNSIRAERGQEPFRPLPPAVLDGSAAPERRLRDLLHYFPTLVPAAGDHHIVVGLLPIECTDFGGYAHLLASAATASELSAGLRLVIYDERLDKRLGPRLRALGTERLVTFDVDFSTPALTQELLIASADASLPLTERMSSLLQLAAIDFAYKRYPSAIEKYAALYDYYEREELGQMQALCLVGAGDALRGSGDRRAAMQMLQRGLALAGKHAALAVLLNGLLSISEVCAELGDFADAESYAATGTRVAAAALNPYAYADLYQRQGDAQRAQSKLVQALTSYDKCRQLCRAYEYRHRWQAVLQQAIGVYRELAMTAERRAAERELDEARQHDDIATGESRGARA